MNEFRTADERLLAALLKRTDDTMSSDAEHLDDETLAEFCDGTLVGERRETAVQHLSDCASCREVIAAALKDAPSPTLSVVHPVRDSHRSIVWTLTALAASLVLAVGTWWWSHGPSDEAGFYAAAQTKLRARDFAAVEQLAADAERRGLSSSRIRNVQANAARKIPDPSALAFAGRLNNFGYDLGGVVARAPAPSEGLQAAATLLTDDDRLSLLNRGHIELTRNQPAVARQRFQSIIDRVPNDAEAWLGLGLASFLADDYAAAEAAFAKAAALDPNSISIAWNRAMTLEELGRPAEAASLWKAILPQLTDDAERRKVEAHLSTLPPTAAEGR